MNLLLDTHVLLWWLADDPRLGADARRRIADPGARVVVSAASVWEIAIKPVLGKLEAPEDVSLLLSDEGFEPLAIDTRHAEVASALPMHHRDPFDRMLVAQAHAEGLELMTRDGALKAYGIEVVPV